MKGLRNFGYILLFLFQIPLFSCNSNNTSKTTKSEKTIPETLTADTIKNVPDDPFKTKTIKLLITNHFATYYIYKGESCGLGFELFEQYAKSRGFIVELELIHDIEHVRDSIVMKKAHFAAATFITPKNRIKNTLYTNSIYTTDLQLIQRKEKGKSVVYPSLQTPVKAVLIKDAPYEISIFKDREPIPGLTHVAAPPLSSKQMLVEDVADSVIDFTICSRLEAEILKVFYPNLDNSVTILKEAEVSFMVNPNCHKLLEDFNRWLSINENTSDYQWTIIKYNSFPKSLRRAMQRVSLSEKKGIISNYDPLVKKHAKNINWDWKLLSALIYQESHFNPTERSPGGAMGLMQLMPRTAQSLAHTSSKQLLIPEKNIIAGTIYLDWIKNNFFNESLITNENRVKFILAAYNSGPGHVADARALAKKYNLDPNVWDDNVEVMMLKKSRPQYYRDPVCKSGYCRGTEPVNYVKNILMYYSHYQKYNS